MFPHSTHRVTVFLCLVLLVVSAVHAQITGKVVNKETQEEIVGANVLIVNTNMGTTTDDKGFDMGFHRRLSAAILSRFSRRSASRAVQPTFSERKATWAQISARKATPYAPAGPLFPIGQPFATGICRPN